MAFARICSLDDVWEGDMAGFQERKNKKGKILNTISDISSVIKNYINDNDVVMIKGSNATGLNNFSKKLKEGEIN